MESILLQASGIVLDSSLLGRQRQPTLVFRSVVVACLFVIKSLCPALGLMWHSVDAQCHRNYLHQPSAAYMFCALHCTNMLLSTFIVYAALWFNRTLLICLMAQFAPHRQVSCVVLVFVAKCCTGLDGFRQYYA